MSKKGGKKKGGKAKEVPIEEPAAAAVLSPRTVTGTLSSHPLSRDLKFENFSLSLHGTELIKDCALELNYGRRYGLIGLNGCGKTSMLDCLGTRELPVPESFETYHLRHEAAASDKTAVEVVMEDLEQRRIRLEAEAEELSVQDDPHVPEQLDYIYEQLDELDADKALAKASLILHGLGFDPKMQNTPTKDFSGGWRMRISLAKALFMQPTLLLLDEPTNHLDLEACVWLERYLRKWKHILLLVSHSQDFLNTVCTNIILLRNQKLTYWSGNYDQYVKTRKEVEENQMKQYHWEQDQIAQMKEYIARFGHGSAKLAAQAQSKEKTLARMQEKGLTEAVTKDHVISFRFPDPGKLPPPVCQFVDVTFGYSKERILFNKLDFGVDLDSRVALVGLNGAGKSTLLKLMVGELQPTDGTVRRHLHLKWGWYHQHLAELLELEMTPLEFMFHKYPNTLPEQGMRRVLGMFGVSGKMQTTPIKIMSDGLKNRVVFAWIAFKEPHILLLDEPTNHLDLETIDSLAEAINDFPGGLVLVSHDFRLINQVAKEIWEVKDQGVHVWKGDIAGYKAKLAALHAEDE